MSYTKHLTNRAVRRYGPLVCAAVFALPATKKLMAADVTFSPGAYIIDMGVMPQTAANGLKPFGLLYSLVVSNQIPVAWAINPNIFFSSRRRHTISDRDWSSDVCSSD